MTPIVVALEVIKLCSDGVVLSETACPCCREPLAIHQPDPGWPERLLGACHSCRTWFLIDTVAAIILRLPGEDDFQRG
jgi:hypothetical protein